MIETGNLRFGGDVLPEQCNFGGMGATGNGKRGLSFDTVLKGLRAQALHLRAYAGYEPGVDILFAMDPASTEFYDAELVHIGIAAEELCRRFSARVLRDVKIAPAPAWMADRLRGHGRHTVVLRLVQHRRQLGPC